MEHCRGFIKGLKVGLVAAPLMGILSFMILLKVKPGEARTEIGGLDVLISETMFCLPVSVSMGALTGAISDARRDRQTPQILTVVLLLLIVVPIMIVFLASWFVRIVGERWLFDHGLYLGIMGVPILRQEVFLLLIIASS